MVDSAILHIALQRRTSYRSAASGSKGERVKFSFPGEVRCEESGAERVLYVVNSLGASLVISFFEPFRQTEVAEPTKELVTETEIKERFGDQAQGRDAARWVSERLDAFAPSLIVFCRYSGPQARTMIEWARAHQVPTIFHIDDDLLNVPIELGASKHALHNHPDRLTAIRYLLAHATLVYCSTPALKRRLFGDAEDRRVVSGELYCAHRVLRPPTPRGCRVVGYMGTDHSYDFAPVVPALVRLMEARPDATFEIFGSTPMPEQLKRFGNRVRTIATVRDYPEFMETLATLGWAVGICALATTPFNAVKADTKWAEYTASGFAVVATHDTVYDRCCSEGCGILADGEDQWFEAFVRLLDDDEERIQYVSRAQEKLGNAYEPERLRAQIADVFARAKSLAREFAQQPTHAHSPPETLLTIDELRGDKIWGWAWGPGESGSPEAEREPVELWCGSVRIGSVPRKIARKDVDAHVGDATGAKGFLITGGSLFGLWSLFGAGDAMTPVLRFADTSASLVEAGSAFRDIAAFRTLRNATKPQVWNVQDVWWANPRILKLRTGARATGASPADFASLRVMQVLADADGFVRLTLVDEQPCAAAASIMTIGVHNALMPLVFIGCDANGQVAFVDFLPFPSLMRGGLHETELAAVGVQGGTLADACALNDAYLAEQSGWGGTASPHTIRDVAVDLSKATGAEAVFDPDFRAWLVSVFGVGLDVSGTEERHATDLGDETFVTFATDALKAAHPAPSREGRATLHLPGNGVPSIGAMVSRRWPTSRSPKPGPFVLADDAFPDRRWLVGFPGGVNELYGAEGSGLEIAPHLKVLDGEGDRDDTEDDTLAPVAIVFRDLDARADAMKLFPVPKDEAAISLPDTLGSSDLVSVLVVVSETDLDLRVFLGSLATQRAAGGFELLVGVARHHAHHVRLLNESLDALLPGRARVIECDLALRTSEIINRLATEAQGRVLVVLDRRTLLHDERTIDALARIASLPDAGTVGCMILRPSAKAPAALPVFQSAGLFPGRIDFSLAPHIGLSEPDCSVILPDMIYPVAANSPLCWAVSASVWREAEGLAASVFPGASAEVDLAIRLAGSGRTNLCTTKVSALSDAGSDVQRMRDLGASSHLGIWRLLPALRRSTILRAF